MAPPWHRNGRDNVSTTSPGSWIGSCPVQLLDPPGTDSSQTQRVLQHRPGSSSIATFNEIIAHSPLETPESPRAIITGALPSSLKTPLVDPAIRGYVVLGVGRVMMTEYQVAFSRILASALTDLLPLSREQSVVAFTKVDRVPRKSSRS